MLDDDGGASTEWVDGHGVAWRVDLPAGRIVLRDAGQTIEIPAKEWRRDVYVAVHGSGFIVRFERFDSSVGFVVSAEQAAPLLAHLGVPPGKQPLPEAIVETATPARPLLWPKVSPLAIWALICSSLVFVPYVGLLPALATIILLILHRVRVRRSAAYSHSRAICVAAFAMLVLGATVSAVATALLLKHGGAFGQTSIFTRPHEEKNIAAIVYGLFVVLLSLTVHEAAHAITAWWLGDGLARSLGRVTLNPLAHIDPFGTVLLPAIMFWVGGPVFGYARPVPVRVEELPRWRRAHILIALAGPGSNLLLACTSLLLLLGVGCAVRIWGDGAYIANFANPDVAAPISAPGLPLSVLVAPLCMILKISFFINVALAMFNLIPIPPLDGSWVLEHMFPGTLGRLYAVLRPIGMWLFLGAIYFHVFDYLAYPVLAVVISGLVLLSAATGM